MIDHPFYLSFAFSFLYAGAVYVRGGDNLTIAALKRFFGYPFWAVILVFFLCAVFRRLTTSYLWKIARTRHHQLQIVNNSRPLVNLLEVQRQQSTGVHSGDITSASPVTPRATSRFDHV